MLTGGMMHRVDVLNVANIELSLISLKGKKNRKIGERNFATEMKTVLGGQEMQNIDRLFFKKYSIDTDGEVFIYDEYADGGPEDISDDAFGTAGLYDSDLWIED